MTRTQGGDRTSGGWIDDIIVPAVGELATGPLLPPRLGPWRVRALLGEGGQGKVYRAERSCDGVTQVAAVKVLSRSLGAEALFRRFHQERQILASLDHPNVARFLLADRTVSGRPYLAMDFIEGQPIDRHCHQRRLDLRARLTLVQTVAMAVHAVHRHGVIHRDIKPNNLLVTADGIPKLLDFGVAKLVIGTGEEGVTATALAPFTPGYASPEQMLGGAITTAVDVYALGVLLYRLLTGCRPYRLHGKTPLELARDLAHRTPPLASVAAAGGAAGTSLDADGDSADPQEKIAIEHPAHALRGDLDTIVAKAMHREPERRYASAAALADDLGRYLEGRPVLARPDTFGYRMSKLVRRHRMATAAAVAVLTLTLSLVAFYTLRLRTERDRALSLQGALQRVLESVDPNATQGEDASGVIVATALAEVEKLAGQPGAQAELMETLAQVLRNLRRHPEARDLLERSLAIRRSLGRNAPMASTLLALGVLTLEQDDLNVPETYLLESLQMRLVLYGRNSLEVAAVHQQLAEIAYVRGEREAARETIEAVLALRRDRLPVGHLDIAAALDLVGALAEPRAAVPVYREALAIRRASLGDRHMKVAENWNNLSFVLRARGKHTDDEADLQAAVVAIHEALSIYKDLVGENTMDTAIGLLNLGTIQRDQKRPIEALEVCRSALDLARRLGGETHLNVLKTLYCVGRAQIDLGDPAGAETTYREAVQVTRQRILDDPTRQDELASPLRRLGLLLNKAGRPSDAVPLLRESEAIRASTTTACGLADALVATGQIADAEPYRRRCAA